MQESKDQSIYEPPVLEELGHVHELTEGPILGTVPDTVFPHLKLSGT